MSTDMFDMLRPLREAIRGAHKRGTWIVSIATLNELRREAGAEVIEWHDETALVRIDSDGVRLLGDNE